MSIKRNTDAGVNKGPFAKVSNKYKYPQPPLLGLCFRCEHRARYHETGIQPRLECGEAGKSKSACYMYAPVRPLIVKPIKGESRPLFGMHMLSGRMEAVSVADDSQVEAIGCRVTGGVMVTWECKSKVAVKNRRGRK